MSNTQRWLNHIKDADRKEHERLFREALRVGELMDSDPNLRRTSKRKPPKNVKEWMDYNPQTSMWAGELYEDYVNNAVHFHTGEYLGMHRTYKQQATQGENKKGVEIKFDRRHHYTTNLFFETESRANINIRWEQNVGFKKDWVNKLAIGTIYGGKHGDHGIIYFYSPDRLRQLEGGRPVVVGNKDYNKTPLTKGYLLYGDECWNEADYIVAVDNLAKGEVRQIKKRNA